MTIRRLPNTTTYEDSSKIPNILIIGSSFTTIGSFGIMPKKLYYLDAVLYCSSKHYMTSRLDLLYDHAALFDNQACPLLGTAYLFFERLIRENFPAEWNNILCQRRYYAHYGFQNEILEESRRLCINKIYK